MWCSVMCPLGVSIGAELPACWIVGRLGKKKEFVVDFDGNWILSDELRHL